jgi:hypothetical protein
MFSLREFLWEKIYGGELPPDTLVLKEFFYSLIGVLIIALFWFIFRRLFFHIAQRAKPARATAWMFCGCSALGWFIGSLEPMPFGYGSFKLMVLLILLSFIGSIVYLSWINKKY